MAAAISVTPAAPRSILDVCRIEVTGADHARPPDGTGGQFTYRLVTERPDGSEIARPLKSHEFNVSHDGKHEWDNLIFDEAGEWTLKLIDTSDESVEASLAVTVS